MFLSFLKIFFVTVSNNQSDGRIPITHASFQHLRELVPPSFPHYVRRIFTVQVVAGKEYLLWPSLRLKIPFLHFGIPCCSLRLLTSSRGIRIARYLCNRLRLIHLSRFDERYSVRFILCVSFDTYQYLFLAFSYQLVYYLFKRYALYVFLCFYFSDRSVKL